jgi:hypothetical protein
MRPKRIRVVDQHGPEWPCCRFVTVQRFPKMVIISGDSNRARALVDTRPIWSALADEIRAECLTNEVMNVLYGSDDVTPHFSVPRRFEARILAALRSLPFEWITGPFGGVKYIK